MQQTVCKYRNGSTYEYSPYAYGKQHCGYVYKYKDTDACIAERAQYMPAFLRIWSRESTERLQTVSSSFMPTTTKMMKSFEYGHLIRPLHLMRLRRYILNVNINKTLTTDFLRISVPKCVSNTIPLCVSFNRDNGTWQTIPSTSSITTCTSYNQCVRPEHHEVVFKGKVNPLTANRNERSFSVRFPVAHFTITRYNIYTFNQWRSNMTIKKSSSEKSRLRRAISHKFIALTNDFLRKLLSKPPRSPTC